MDVNVKKSSLKYQIASSIRNDIFRGKLSPGDKLTETYITKKLGVSRGPVREAMQLLVMKGLLVSTTYKETRINNITTEEVTDLLIPLRVSIETFALKKSYASWSQQYIEKFEELLEQMKRAVMLNDMFLFNDVDIKFHELIISASNKTNVVHLWESIVNRIRLHFFYQNRLSLDLQKYTEDHRYLLDAFKKGDLDFAVEALQNHIIKTNSPAAELLPDEEIQDEQIK